MIKEEIKGIEPYVQNDDGSWVVNSRHVKEYENKQKQEKIDKQISNYGNVKDIKTGYEICRNIGLSNLSTKEVKQIGKFVKGDKEAIDKELSIKLLQIFLNNTEKYNLEKEQNDRFKGQLKNQKVEEKWLPTLFSGNKWCISLPEGIVKVHNTNLNGLDFIGFNNGVYFAIEAKNNKNLNNSVNYCSNFIEQILKLNNTKIVPYVIHGNKSLFKENYQNYVYSEPEFCNEFKKGNYCNNFEIRNKDSLIKFKEMLKVFKEKYKKELLPNNIFQLSNILVESFFNY
jgi:hypothetical protein